MFGRGKEAITHLEDAMSLDGKPVGQQSREGELHGGDMSKDRRGCLEAELLDRTWVGRWLGGIGLSYLYRIVGARRSPCREHGDAWAPALQPNQLFARGRTESLNPGHVKDGTDIINGFSPCSCVAL